MDAVTPNGSPVPTTLELNIWQTSLSASLLPMKFVAWYLQRSASFSQSSSSASDESFTPNGLIGIAINVDNAVGLQIRMMRPRHFSPKHSCATHKIAPMEYGCDFLQKSGQFYYQGIQKYPWP